MAQKRRPTGPRRRPGSGPKQAPRNPADQALVKEIHRIAVMLDEGKPSHAMKAATELVRKHPKHPSVLAILGASQGELGRHPDSVVSYERSLKFDPKSVETRFRFVLALQKAGQFERGLEEVERLLFYSKNDLRALRSKVVLLTELGRNEKAFEVIKLLREMNEESELPRSDRLSIAVTSARLAPEFVDRAQLVEEMSQLVTDGSINPATRSAAWWNIGRLCEQLKRYDESFDAYTKAKKITNPRWDPDDHSRRCDALIKCWEKDCGVPSAPRDGSRLVFVLGMMRSGTSLTEQMIAQLDGVTPGGEMNAISRQVALADSVFDPGIRPIPFTRTKYMGHAVERMANAAWKMYDQVATEGVITDKQPYNYFYVPLITRMFPGCKIIHCVRDPQDTCLSAYFQSFSRPHPQTHDLNWIGRYYRDYQRVMDAWHATGDCNMIDVVYEQMTADPEAQTRRIAEFIGMDWSDSMLRFHESDRTVLTASREQVRKPIYQSSVKKHELYAAHLGPLREALGDELVNRQL